jgi:hypothetical protein
MKKFADINCLQVSQVEDMGEDMGNGLASKGRV